MAQRMSLLSSQCCIQAPYIKVKIGNYTFGVYNKSERKRQDEKGFYTSYQTVYPNYVQSLNIVKINGQVNQYSLQLAYPVTQNDDPNFFDKVISSVSNTRKIVFTYGDANQPSYIYKEEEATITDVQQSFGFGSGGSCNSVITYTIKAVSACALLNSGVYNFIYERDKLYIPSELIKNIFKTDTYGLKKVFTGMSVNNLDRLIVSGDKPVKLQTKTNQTALDHIKYLVSCMVPNDQIANNNRSQDLYVMTVHDETVYDQLYSNTDSLGGPYFQVSRVSSNVEHSDAYEIDIGIGTNSIVTDFKLDNNKTYSLYYDFQRELDTEQYVRRIDNGKWVDVYSPTISSGNDQFSTRPEDINWWSQVTKYPVSGSITVLGLLRPATLLQYIRINVVFPGGHRHNASGLYIVTKQQDSISYQGYKTTLSITRIAGDTDLNA